MATLQQLVYSICATNISDNSTDSGLNSYMGIIPELERVFITIDHTLFLWDYMEG